MFPFHQGRFQGWMDSKTTDSMDVFPFHQGRFQGSAMSASTTWTSLVSIPPRKVSRRASLAELRRLKEFPFHQGRFQGRWRRRTKNRRGGVSIPPRKVSRFVASAEVKACLNGFHSTKEGFKGERRGAEEGARGRVSIPPRKVSRKSWIVAGLCEDLCFHSTKEGFKVQQGTGQDPVSAVFPFHQGRFQGMPRHWPSGRRFLVSIPPRKVSRPLFPNDPHNIFRCFHSTKEGFKEPPPTCWIRWGL